MGPPGDCSSVSVCVFCPGQIQVLAGGGPTHPSLGFLRGRRENSSRMGFSRRIKKGVFVGQGVEAESREHP